jgi:hypothetical protein
VITRDCTNFYLVVCSAIKISLSYQYDGKENRKRLSGMRTKPREKRKEEQGATVG